MKLNGSLIMATSSFSEVKNLHLEKVITNPAITVSDVGRVIYNTTTGEMLVGTLFSGVPRWITPASSGALQAEVDAIEATLGLNEDGTFDETKFTDNLAGQTSYVSLITKIQTLITENATAISYETARAVAAESMLTDATVGFDAAINANATAISEEALRAKSAENALNLRVDAVDTGTLRNDLNAEIARASLAESQNALSISNETARAKAAEDAINERVDAIDQDILLDAIAAEQTRAEGVESQLSNRLLGEINRATGVENVIDAKLTDEVTRAEAAEAALGLRIDNIDASAIRADLTAEIDRATAAEAILNTKINNEATRAGNAEIALGVRIDNIDASAIRADLTAEIDRATAAESDLNTKILTETSRSTAAESALSTQILNEVSRATAAENDLQTQITVLKNSETWLLPINFMVPDHTTKAGIPNGQRVLNTTTWTVYTSNGTGFLLSKVLTPGCAFDSLEDFKVYVFNGTLVVAIGGGSTVLAGDGIVVVNNTVSVNSNSNTLTAGQGTLDISTAFVAKVDKINTDLIAESTRATTAEGDLASSINQEITRATTAEAAINQSVLDEVARAKAAEVALGNRIDNANVGQLRNDLTNEITRATNKETELAGSISTNATNLTTEIANRKAGYFLYTSASALTTHTVTHNIGQQFCTVMVINSTNNMIIPDEITFSSANALTVTFNTATTCKIAVTGVKP